MRYNLLLGIGLVQFLDKRGKLVAGLFHLYPVLSLLTKQKQHGRQYGNNGKDCINKEPKTLVCLPEPYNLNLLLLLLGLQVCDSFYKVEVQSLFSQDLLSLEHHFCILLYLLPVIAFQIVIQNGLIVEMGIDICFFLLYKRIHAVQHNLGNLVLLVLQIYLRQLIICLRAVCCRSLSRNLLQFLYPQMHGVTTFLSEVYSVQEVYVYHTAVVGKRPAKLPCLLYIKGYRVVLSKLQRRTSLVDVGLRRNHRVLCSHAPFYPYGLRSVGVGIFGYIPIKKEVYNHVQAVEYPQIILSVFGLLFALPEQFQGLAELPVTFIY